MGIGTYFIGLLPSGLAAFLLAALLKALTHRWQPGFWRAALRALPIALAFAPTMLMKRGLGVLLPASVTLCAEMFGGRPLDGDDRKNISAAATSLIVVWAITAVIVYIRSVAKANGHGK